jgi:hypothetical protein
MIRRIKTAVFCIGLSVPLLQSAGLTAADTTPTPAAPIPTQILTAKKVFIANAGGDQPFYEEPLFSGGPDRAYNQFYAAMKTWGRYELVGAPGDADLLIEILFTVPRIEQKVVRGQAALVPIPYDPQFRVVVRDPKTSALLWAFTEHAEWAILQRNRDKNFDRALAKVVSDMQGWSASAGSTSNP